MLDSVPILGYEGLYEVNTMAQVYSLYKGKVLKPKLRNNGYLEVSLYRNGEAASMLIHRIVAIAFVDGYEDDLVVCHIDSDPTNNLPSNLRWGTQQSNILDVIKAGNNFEMNKTECPLGHPLESPNLVPSKLVRGHRNCLACQRAGNFTRYYDREDLLPEVSDLCLYFGCTPGKLIKMGLLTLPTKSSIVVS